MRGDAKRGFTVLIAKWGINKNSTFLICSFSEIGFFSPLFRMVVFFFRDRPRKIISSHTSFGGIFAGSSLVCREKNMFGVSFRGRPCNKFIMLLYICSGDAVYKACRIKRGKNMNREFEFRSILPEVVMRRGLVEFLK